MSETPTWISDFDLAYGTVTGRFVAISYDSADTNPTPDVQPLNGSVTLTPTTPAGRIDGALAQIQAVTLRIFGGQIVDDEDIPGIRVLSNDANIGVGDWAWRATFRIPGFPLSPVTFRLARDATFNLTSDLIPIESMPYRIIEGASIVDAEVDGGGKVRFALSDGTFTGWIDIPNGEQGIPGAPGTKGDPGPAGASATLAMGTVAQGPTAQAWMTGTESARELNLVLPRGPKGDKGDPGSGGGSAAQVEYNGTTWPARPAISGAVTWVSTQYRTAPYPPTQPTTSTGMAIGDMLIRHPEATA